MIDFIHQFFPIGKFQGRERRGGREGGGGTGPMNLAAIYKKWRRRRAPFPPEISCVSTEEVEEREEEEEEEEEVEEEEVEGGFHLRGHCDNDRKSPVTLFSL